MNVTGRRWRVKHVIQRRSSTQVLLTTVRHVNLYVSFNKFIPNNKL